MLTFFLFFIDNLIEFRYYFPEKGGTMVLLSQLRKDLMNLKENYGVESLKGGTEVEDMEFEELKLLHDISEGIVPLIVKIGGPEARNDMRNLFTIKVEGILAPMIESVYSFRNYVKTALELLKEYGVRPMLCINAETMTFFENMEKIIADPYFEKIDAVTVGRSDLSGSMEIEDVDHPEVTRVTAAIISRMKSIGKLTSVGGKLTPESIMNVKENIKPDKANTRHIGISMNYSGSLKEACAMALGYETKLYEAMITAAPHKEMIYKRRIDETKRRMIKGFAKAALIA